MLWRLRSTTVVSADRVIGEPTLGHPGNVSHSVAATKAALGNPKVKIRPKLNSGKDTGLRQGPTRFLTPRIGRLAGRKMAEK